MAVFIAVSPRLRKSPSGDGERICEVNCVVGCCGFGAEEEDGGCRFEVAEATGSEGFLGEVESPAGNGCSCTGCGVVCISVARGNMEIALGSDASCSCVSCALSVVGCGSVLAVFSPPCSRYMASVLGAGSELRDAIGLADPSSRFTPTTFGVLSSSFGSSAVAEWWPRGALRKTVASAGRASVLTELKPHVAIGSGLVGEG